MFERCTRLDQGREAALRRLAPRTYIQKAANRKKSKKVIKDICYTSRALRGGFNPHLSGLCVVAGLEVNISLSMFCQ